MPVLLNKKMKDLAISALIGIIIIYLFTRSTSATIVIGKTEFHDRTHYKLSSGETITIHSIKYNIGDTIYE